MIEIFGPDEERIGLFKNYDELFKYIITTENLKLLGCHPQSLRETWNFIHYTPEIILFVLSKSGELFFTEEEKEAYQRGINLIEIYKGDYQNPVQIPVTPNLDIPALKKAWCQEYCAAYRYTLAEYYKPYIVRALP